MDSSTRNQTWHGEEEHANVEDDSRLTRRWSGINKLFDEDLTTFWNPRIKYRWPEGAAMIPEVKRDDQDQTRLTIEFKV